MKSLIFKSKKTRRIDSYAKSIFPHLSKKLTASLFEKGNIRVNDRKVKKGYMLKDNDRICFKSVPKPQDMYIKPNSRIALKILYEDKFIVGVFKPKGLPSHPIKHSQTKTIINALVSRFPEISEAGPKKLEGGLLHRLDNDTSGILIAAKNKEAFKEFKNIFNKKKLTKEYIALVLGRPLDKGKISLPLMRHHKNRRKMKVANILKNKTYLNALTEYKIIKRFKEYSLLKIKLNTAATHQIRIHLAEIGHPIAGDRLYQSKAMALKDQTGLKGQFLHASKVRFMHPFTEKSVSIDCEFDEELQLLLNKLP